MKVEAALDNDILFKCSCYDLLGPVCSSAGGGNALAILGAAKYVVRKYLNQNPALHDAASATARLEDFIAKCREVEPSESELELAAKFEEFVMRTNLELDTGESLLCAVIIERDIPRLVTGDKRAVAAVEALCHAMSGADVLRGRIISLELLVQFLVDYVGSNEVRRRVCTEPAADKALAIAFSCSGRSSYDPQGLASYIRNLRQVAPTALWDASKPAFK